MSNKSVVMDWVSQLPARLGATAYRAANEHAWNRRDVLDVIDWLSFRGIPVLGVDVWLPTHPGPTIPTPCIYEWSAPSNLLERSDVFVQNAMAKKYISEFEWGKDDRRWHGETPYFNLTV